MTGMPGFGNKFKAAREELGVTLKDIAQETRISTRFLRAIESETFGHLPGGVFNRGFIRTYAARVGLDPEAAVEEYRSLATGIERDEPEDDPVTTNGPLRVSSSDTHVLSIAIGGLVVLIVLFYVFSRDSGGTATEAATLLPATAQTVAAEPIRAATLESSPLPEPNEMSLSSAASPLMAGDPLSPITGNLEVRIEVHDATWVSILVDGQELIVGEVLNAGVSRRYTASEALELTIGNAAGLTLVINGREVPSLGATGQVRILTITPDNVDRLVGNS